jgi:hypothetical protein
MPDVAPRAEPTPAAKNALRRPSGVCSLGGAGLFPELCNAPGTDRSGRHSKGSNTTAALPKNDAQFAGLDSQVLGGLDSKVLAASRSDRDGDAPAGSPADEPKAPAGTLNEAANCLRRLRSPACGPNSAPPAPLGPFSLGQEQSVSAWKQIRREQLGNEGFGARSAVNISSARIA